MKIKAVHNKEGIKNDYDKESWEYYKVGLRDVLEKSIRDGFIPQIGDIISAPPQEEIVEDHYFYKVAIRTVGYLNDDELFITYWVDDLHD